MKRPNVFIVLMLLYSCMSGFAQNNAIDSLRNVLQTEPDDTNKVNTLNNLSEKLEKAGKYDSSFIHANRAKELAEKVGFKKGIASAYRIIGIVDEDKGNYPSSLENQNKALAINSEINNKIGIASNLGNLGNVYEDQSDYQKALEYDLKALAINRDIGEKNGISINLGNIGNIYDELGNYPKALEYDFKALKIAGEIGNKIHVIANLGNIGNIYNQQVNYASALEYYFKALAIAKEIGNKSGIAINLSNIGIVYYSQRNYPKALEYSFKALDIDKEMSFKTGIASSLCIIANIYEDQGKYSDALMYNFKALNISREIGDKYDVAQNMEYIGSIYIKQKNSKLARDYLDSSLDLSKKIGAKVDIKSSYKDLAQLDSTTGNYASALSDYKNYIVYSDSLINEANTKKTVQAEMNYEFEQKQAAQKAEQDKKDAVAEQERRKQVLIRNSFMAGFVLMISLAFFIFRGYRQKQKANQIITGQKAEVEKQKALAEHQKAIVEEKNKDITDSIKYASRIQRALLTTDEYISKYLKEYFILFKPRDIVSGDFYWAYAEQPPVISGQSSVATFHIACCDCTGHGVPGAFMSLLNISMLNEAVIEKNITRPDLVLNDVRTNIIKALNPEGSDKGSKDGMDCIYCSIDMESKMLYVACANNPLWIVRSQPSVNSGQSLQEIPADKMPVGIQYGEQKPFTLHSMPIVKGDCIYLFSDGYADQFGGSKGKKFKYKQLQQLIMDNCQLTMAEQKQILEKTFENWKGDLEQIDDVLIIGIRV
ncbi:MAG: tetratricopeptide repeat protein [Bacteroidia bacterium]